jgi:hypothetical protein
MFLHSDISQFRSNRTKPKKQLASIISMVFGIPLQESKPDIARWNRKHANDYTTEVFYRMIIYSMNF